VDTSLMTVGDTELEVRRHGTGDPLIFLHGEDGLIFATPVLEALGKQFEVIAPHLPGFGRSSRPAYVKTVRDLALVMSELIDTLPGPVPVVGASLGAWVALELGLIDRSHVSHLVLAAPVGVKVGGREERDFADLWTAAFADMKPMLYGDPAAAPNLDALSDEDLVYLTECQESVARYCWAPYMHDPALRHWARRISCPTLVVTGSADRFALLPDYYARFAKLIGSGAECRVIDGAGHRVEEEAPRELASLVEELVATSGSTTAAAAAGRS
jgi:pimeloyl-ACP methyl ester carboxylesterase